MSVTDYQQLTPELIVDAIESLGIYPETGLTPLNSYENRVYQFRCDRQQRYVVKFYRPQRWTDAQIIEEHQFAQELIAQEIPLSAPLMIDGQSLHQYQGYRFALFASLGGRAFDHESFDHLEQVGRFLGRLHQLGQSKPFQHRLALTPTSYGRQALAQLQQSQHIPAHLTDRFSQEAEQMLSQVEAIWQQLEAPMIRTHGDLHLGNLLETSHGIGFVDLDDASMAPAIQDLWMLLHGDRREQSIQLDCLLEGYQEFSAFDSKQLQLIEPLRSLRLLHHCSWISRRWDDPTFPQHFPWFNEDSYWQQQIQFFQEQQQALAAPSLQLTLY